MLNLSQLPAASRHATPSRAIFHGSLHLLVAFYALVWTLSCIQSQAQTTINVPKDQPTIQAGINAASNGDTVLVAPGTYKENIDFMGKAITVISSGGAASTIIDGGMKTAVVTFQRGEPRAALLNGFTLQNGAATGGGYANGGGIYILESFPTITNNIVTDNQGCGIDSSLSGPSIQGNVIRNSTPSSTGANSCFGAVGGGMALEGQPGCESSECPVQQPGIPDAAIIGNTFENNVAQQGGGALTLWDVGEPLIENNVFRFNQTNEGGGAIQWLNDGAPIIVQNLMYGNAAYASYTEVGNGLTGGALDLEIPDGQSDTIGAKVVNNTIYGNKSGNSTLPNQPGSQIYITGFYQNFRMSNNIVVSNGPNSAMDCDDSYVPGQVPQIDHNDVFNSGGPAYSGSCTMVAEINANISSDPKLKSPATDDFHQTLGSPVIDSGNNDAPDLPLLDLDGNPRIQDATNLGHAIIDMGVYEYPGRIDLPMTVTHLVSTPNPANISQPITFTATLSASSGTPNGTVLFSDEATTLYSGTAAGGVVSFATSSLSAGSHAITASYQGSSAYAASSASLTEVVIGLPTATGITVAPSSVYALQPAALTAKVTAKGGTPSGAATFTANGAAIGAAMLNSDGVASLNYAFLSSGPESIAATYSGDATFSPSTSSAAAENVAINTTTAQLAVAPNLAPYSAVTTLTAKIASPTGASFIPAAIPAGSVTFYDGATSLESATLNASAVATITLSSLHAGSHALTAVYAGTAAFAASASTADTLIVNPAATATTLSATPNPADIGTSVTLAATVSGPGSPTGNVAFFDGTTQIANVPLDAKGNAVFTADALSVGTHLLTAAYAATQNYTASVSPAVSELVLPYTGDFTIAAAPESVKLYTGEAASYTITLSPNGGWNQNVTLACSGLPANTTCTLAPTAIAAGNGSSALVVQTSAPHRIATSASEPLSWPTRAKGALAAVALLVLPFRLRRKGRYSALLVFAVLAALGVLNGCGAGPVAGGTPPGTYTLSVSATFSQYGQTLVHTTPIKVTVQSLF